MKLYVATAILASVTLHAQAPNPAAGITLPLEEYNRLSDLARRPSIQPAAPPSNYALKAAELNLRVAGESVTGSIRIDGEVLSTGLHKVPLTTDMIVLDAQRTGPQQVNMDLPLEQDGGTHSAILNGPAEFGVTLQIARPLRFDTGRASFDLPVPSAGAARLTLEVPGAQTLVNISPGLITRRATAGNTTTIEATLVPGERTTIWWAARLPVAPAPVQETRFVSDVKSLITVADSEVIVAALTEVTILRGEPTEFRVEIPKTYELTSVTGPTLVTSSLAGSEVRLTVSNGAARNHQFLLSFSRAQMNPDAEVPLPSFTGTQRETGEVLIEGAGAMELAATELGGLRRMDIKEASAYLRGLSSGTLHAAFRYQKRPPEAPAVSLKWARFPESDVLSAVSQNATVTTLVTSEGRSLTEVKLTLKNRAQPFLKIDLPAGATILSAEVAGVAVKPVTGADGNRIPLFRPGFRPVDNYEVSFVFLHAGAPFNRKGDAELVLPKMDIPVARLLWEVFLPERYKVSRFAGDPLVEQFFPYSTGEDAREEPTYSANQLQLPMMIVNGIPPTTALANGQIGGTVTDQSGGVIPGARVQVQHDANGTIAVALTDRNGRWTALAPAGRLQVSVDMEGFKSYRRTGLNHFADRPTRIDAILEVGAATESITVTDSRSMLKVEAIGAQTSNFTAEFGSAGGALFNVNLKSQAGNQGQVGSANVQDLQRRVAGVLPIAINIPRAGNSFRFVRPLVIDEETSLTFRYRGK